VRIPRNRSASRNRKVFSTACHSRSRRVNLPLRRNHPRTGRRKWRPTVSTLGHLKRIKRKRLLIGRIGPAVPPTLDQTANRTRQRSTKVTDRQTLNRCGSMSSEPSPLQAVAHSSDRRVKKISLRELLKHHKRRRRGSIDLSNGRLRQVAFAPTLTNAAFWRTRHHQVTSHHPHNEP